VQRATAQSKTGIFRYYGVAETPPGFQAGWSDGLAAMWPSQSKLTLNLKRRILDGNTDMKKYNFVTGSPQNDRVIQIDMERRISIHKQPGHIGARWKVGR
jgi:hypothetical protein